MNLRLLFVFLTLIVLWMAGCQIVQPSQSQSPQAEAGELSLIAWDFAQDGPVELIGEWEFYWEQLLTPQDFTPTSPPTATGLVTLPKSWTNHEIGDQTFPNNGYATYRLRVPIQPTQDVLALKVDIVRTAHRLFVNGQEIGSNGQVGTTFETTTPRYAPYTSAFVSEDDELEIILQVANFHRSAGGPWTTITLGRNDQIMAIRERNVASNLFLFGSLLIVGLYHLGLYTIRRQEQSTIYFGLFSCLIALRIFVTGEMYFIRLFPTFNWETVMRIDILTVYVGLPLFAMFIRELFRHEFSTFVLRIVQVVTLALTVITLTTSARIYTETVLFFEIVLLMVMIYIIVVILQAISHHRDGARVFLVGFLFLFFTVVNDILFENQLIQTGYFTPFGLFGFIFTQTLILSMRFTSAFDHVESLSVERASLHQQLQAAHQSLQDHNRTLETQVQLRTDALEQEVQEHQASVQALWESEAKNRALLAAIPDLIFVLDSNGVYLETHGNLDAYDHPSVVGKRIHDMLPPQLADRIQKGLTQTLATQSMTQIFYDIEVEAEKRYLDTRLVPLNEGKVLMIVRNVTVQRQAEVHLRQAKEAAEAANLAKSTFLTNMSHELRTPLNAILGFAQVMGRDNSLSPQHLDNLKIIEHSGEHLLELINDVLEMSKIEAGGITLVENEFDLHKMLTSLIQMFRIRAEKKNLWLTADLIERVPQYIRADEQKLRQILLNLLSNAVKFTNEGGVHLHVNCRDEAQIWLNFGISDTGIGISPEERDYLFTPFSQTESGRQVSEGTGLGLSISRQYVQMMGGDIQVRSEFGHGSTFQFEVPCIVVDASEMPAMEATRSIVGLAPGQPTHKILIAEDEPYSAELMIQILEPLGFEVKQVSNGQDAVEAVQQDRPDLIFMDMRMPILDGYEATQQIKALPDTEQLVIIALTASAFEHEREAILAMGCDDFIRKPSQAQEILVKLGEHLDVSYVYEDETIAEGELETLPPSLTAAQLMSLPTNDLHRLEQAARSIDLEVSELIIEELEADYPDISFALKQMVKSFRFDTLQSLFDEMALLTKET